MFFGIAPFFSIIQKLKMQANRELLDRLMGADRDGVQIKREVTVCLLCLLLMFRISEIVVFVNPIFLDFVCMIFWRKQNTSLVHVLEFMILC